jgi:hypothetical protein
MRKPAFLIIVCLMVSLGLWPALAFAQHGGGGHGGGGFGGGGFHGGGGGGFHSGGGFSGASHAYGGVSGGYHGNAYGGRSYYGGRGYGYGYGGYPGYGYGWRGGYGYGWHGGYWGYPGWGWGYPYWGWGFGLGWGWPYWWGYPYGYGYSYPNSYYYYSPDSSSCPPGYTCPDNNGDNDPPANPNLGGPYYQGPSYRAPQNAPANPSRPPATTVPQNYAPSVAPSDNFNSPVVSVDHLTATQSSYHAVHANLPSTHLSPKMQNAVQHLEDMPPFAREREIDTGRYSHFTAAEKQILRNVE